MLNELTDALIQGRAGMHHLLWLTLGEPLIKLTDGLMSAVSTFPYNAEECSQFLKLIKAARGEGLLCMIHKTFFG